MLLRLEDSVRPSDQQNAKSILDLVYAPAVSVGQGDTAQESGADASAGRDAKIPTAIIVERLHGQWSAWFDGEPQIASGGTTLAEAVDR